MEKTFALITFTSLFLALGAHAESICPKTATIRQTSFEYLNDVEELRSGYFDIHVSFEGSRTAEVPAVLELSKKLGAWMQKALTQPDGSTAVHGIFVSESQKSSLAQRNRHFYHNPYTECVYRSDLTAMPTFLLAFREHGQDMGYALDLRIPQEFSDEAGKFLSLVSESKTDDVRGQLRLDTQPGNFAPGVYLGGVTLHWSHVQPYDVHLVQVGYEYQAP